MQAETAAAKPGRSLVAALRDAFRDDAPLICLCLVLVVAGIALRVQHVGFPRELTFDEHHFVSNARNYLEGQADWNDHPPLGKLFIALGMLVVGDDSTGWRVASAAFGIGTIAAAYALARTLFQDRRAAWLAAAFVAADGFLIAYSRTALLDGILTNLVLVAAYLAVSARSPVRAALAAAVIGCAANVKLSGFAVGLPVLGVYLVRRRSLTWIATLALAPIVFGLWSALGLWLSRQPHGLGAVVHTTLANVRHHAGLTTFSNPFTSRWYTWFLPVRPIVLALDPFGRDLIRVRSSLGNLALWWSASALFGIAALFTVRSAVVALRARQPFRALEAGTKSTIAAFGLALAMLLPWIIGKRDSYIYHYLPSYAFLLVLLAGWIARAYRKARVTILVYVGVVTLVFAFYAPVWGQQAITEAAYKQRLFFETWR